MNPPVPAGVDGKASDALLKLGRFFTRWEESDDGRVEVAAGDELESRAERAVVDEDADELLHYRVGVVHQFGEAAADLFQGGQREFFPDPRPGLVIDRLTVQCHRCLAAVADVVQEPLDGARIPAQREGAQR